MVLPWWEMLLRLFLAAVAGGIVGLEREMTGKPAGLRTMILVSLGSGLFMILSISAFPSGSTDLGRVAAGVVTGIGFLGAGAIFKEGVTIRGLTTAATIWVTCGLGLAIGAGLYLEAFFTLLLAIIALVVLHPVEESVPKQKLYRLSLTLNPKPERMNDLFSYLREIGARIEEVEQEDAGGTWKISLIVPSKIRIEELLKVMPEYANSYAVSLEKR
ncbi:MAG: MgtC/SapB family protein [Caldiserica bacterium]|jgi:putative Mg2+ transporter-C (MgtC) family protein|nr:MgtC/SapB family protein [Caldisericota bacterium]MDH7563041.1 MgtC/SapB family protein [Caldisericota bacterium]